MVPVSWKLSSRDEDRFWVNVYIYKYIIISMTINNSLKDAIKVCDKSDLM